MIRFDNVSFGYSRDNIMIHQLNFEIQKGEFVALAGENGAGKSTTSKLINGLLKPVSGDVTVMGWNTGTTKTSRIAKHVGFLFQNPDRQLCRNTVREELLFGLDLVTDLKKEEKDRKVEEVLLKLGLDGERDPFRLSRGERQRVALASLLVVEPEILILDEPTTGLDYKECKQIMDAVRELNRQKQVTVVMVCHDMEVVLDYADRVLVMAGGTLLADGETREIFRNEVVMRRASLIPPQITGLAVRLGGRFYYADTVEEMVDALEFEIRKAE